MNKFKLGEIVYIVSGNFWFNEKSEYYIGEEIFQDYYLEGNYRDYHAITIIAPTSDGNYLTNIGLIENINGNFFIRTVLSSEKCLVHLEIVSEKQKLDREEYDCHEKKNPHQR